LFEKYKKTWRWSFGFITHLFAFFLHSILCIFFFSDTLSFCFFVCLFFLLDNILNLCNH
jgi:hypothetical protein